MTSEKEQIKELQKDTEEFNSFLSPQRKAEREAWVVREFLNVLGVGFGASEIILSNDDPPDIIFRDANFEVKEVLDKGRKRHLEVKNDLKRTKQVESL